MTATQHRRRLLLVFFAALGALLLLAGAARAEPDTDFDSVLDSFDNCPNVFNPDQDDFDQDDVGNSCDSSIGGPAEESWVVFYLRDQDGRPVGDAEFDVRDLLAGQLVDEGTVRPPIDAGHVTFNLSQGVADRQEIAQSELPQGCTGGLAGKHIHRFRPGSWQIVTLRYKCGITFTDVYDEDEEGEAEPHAVPVTPQIEMVQLKVSWTDSRDRFDVAGIQIVSNGEVVARGPQSTAKLKPGKLKITRARKATSVTIGITKLKPGKLQFKVVAKNVTKRTKVSTRVTQIK